jgi:glucosamine--fructose-6-phosphate aminotransferase (isomerizing)
VDIFLEETLAQPGVLRAILARCREDGGLLQPLRQTMAPQQRCVLWTGMGTSYFAAYPASIYLCQHGTPSIAIESAELVHYYSGLISERSLMVAISQSGETAEVRRLVDGVRGRTRIVGITNDPASHLARKADVVLPLGAGEERGPATKTYTAALAVSLLLAMDLTSTRSAPGVAQLSSAVDAMERFIERWKETIEALLAFLRGANRLVLLGRGPSVASAMAGALILKEAAKLPAEGTTAGQFRHGPLEEVSADLGAVVFAMPGRTQDLNLRLAQDIARFGGQVVVVGSEDPSPGENMYSLALPRLDEFCAPLAEIVPFQLLAWRMAAERGLTPGLFSHMGKVTLEE